MRSAHQHDGGFLGLHYVENPAPPPRIDGLLFAMFSFGNTARPPGVCGRVYALEDLGHVPIVKSQTGHARGVVAPEGEAVSGIRFVRKDTPQPVIVQHVTDGPDTSAEFNVRGRRVGFTGGLLARGTCATCGAGGLGRRRASVYHSVRRGSIVSAAGRCRVSLCRERRRWAMRAATARPCSGSEDMGHTEGE